MKFIVYETTNLINGKKYRGAHVCETLDDGYLGSGKLLKKAIAKYGFQSFSRTVLVECETADEMFQQEAKFVNLDWVADLNTYNLKVGGEGGWDYINKTSARWTDEKRKAHSVEMKKRRASGEFGPKKPTRGMTGKNHTDLAKIKIGEAQKLDPETIAERSLDVIQSEYPRRGAVKALSELWGVSHTQVRRFIMSWMSQMSDPIVPNTPEGMCRIIQRCVRIADDKQEVVSYDGHLMWFGVLSSFADENQITAAAVEFQQTKDLLKLQKECEQMFIK